MSMTTVGFVMYLLALVSVGIALCFIKDRRQRSIVLVPVAIGAIFLLSHDLLT